MAFEEGWINKQLDKATENFESLPAWIKDLFNFREERYDFPAVHLFQIRRPDQAVIVFRGDRTLVLENQFVNFFGKTRDD